MKKDAPVTNLYKNKYKKMNQHDLDNYLIKACQVYNKEHIEYLLTSPDLTSFANIHYLNGIPFSWLCREGYLDGVKYFLHSPELSSNITDVDELLAGFISSVSEGKVDVVDYLIANTSVSKHPQFFNGCSQYYDIVVSLKRCRHMLCYLITCPHLTLLNTEKSQYNLSWAMEKKYHDVVYAMALASFNRDPLEYLSGYNAIIQNYCVTNNLRFKEWDDAITSSDGNFINNEFDLMA